MSRFRTLSDAALAALKWRLSWRMRVLDTRRPAVKRWWYVPLDRPERDEYGCAVQLPGNGWPTRQAAVDALVRQLAGVLRISVPEFYVHLDSARERIDRAKEEAGELRIQQYPHQAARHGTSALGSQHI